MIIPYKYELAEGFIDGLAIVRTDGLFGIIDEKDQFKIDPKYQSIAYINHYFLYAQLDGNYGVINFEDETILPFIYSKIELTSDNKMFRLYQQDGFTYKKVNEVFK